MKFLLSLACLLPLISFSQVHWTNVDSLFQPLPRSVHVYVSNDSIDGKPGIAYYVEADLKDKGLVFTSDTSHKRRLTPTQFFAKNNQPLLVVNTTFFEFATNRNLNVVIKQGKMVSYNVHTIAGKGKDTLTYKHPFAGTIGISKRRHADVAWTFTDSSKKYAYAMQTSHPALQDSIKKIDLKYAVLNTSILSHSSPSTTLRKWKMKTAIAGGPVLLQNSNIKISNNDELKFAGKAINDRHPRTAMGYTKDGKLIIIAVQGRMPGIAEGASLTHLATLLQQVGCVEALNLDGGGSSCLLINGKETIAPSDKVQRPIPAVFLIQRK